MTNTEGQVKCFSCQVLHYRGCQGATEQGLLLDLWEVAKDWYDNKDDEHPTVRAMAEHELFTVVELIRRYHDSRRAAPNKQYDKPSEVSP